MHIIEIYYETKREEHFTWTQPCKRAKEIDVCSPRGNMTIITVVEDTYPIVICSRKKLSSVDVTLFSTWQQFFHGFQ